MLNLTSTISNLPNPCFILQEDLLAENLQKLNNIELNTGAHILCALKGFSMWNSFPLLNKYISGGTASSLHEVMLINEEMGKKAHCCFVVYDENEFDTVQDNSSHVTFNSINQYGQFQHKLSKNINYALRINPEFSTVAFSQYNPCSAGSRFGILKSQLPQKLPREINGLHLHTLCESSAEDLEKTWRHIDREFEPWLKQISWINLGGGHHITQPSYNIELLTNLILEIKEKYKLEIFLEPGEAIGINTGYLSAKVLDIVRNNGEMVAILNCSFAAHMPDCLEMPYKPEVLSEDPLGEFNYTFGGNTCMSGDFVKGFTFNEPLKIGQTVVFKDMMHYTFVKTNFFNGVKHPALAVIKQNNEAIVLKEFGYKEFKNRLS